MSLIKRTNSTITIQWIAASNKLKEIEKDNLKEKKNNAIRTDALVHGIGHGGFKTWFNLTYLPHTNLTCIRLTPPKYTLL